MSAAIAKGLARGSELIDEERIRREGLKERESIRTEARGVREQQRADIKEEQAFTRATAAEERGFQRETAAEQRQFTRAESAREDKVAALKARIDSLSKQEQASIKAANRASAAVAARRKAKAQQELEQISGVHITEDETQSQIKFAETVAEEEANTNLRLFEIGREEKRLERLTENRKLWIDAMENNDPQARRLLAKVMIDEPVGSKEYSELSDIADQMQMPEKERLDILQQKYTLAIGQLNTLVPANEQASNNIFLGDVSKLIGGGNFKEAEQKTFSKRTRTALRGQVLAEKTRDGTITKIEKQELAAIGDVLRNLRALSAELRTAIRGNRQDPDLTDPFTEIQGSVSE